MFGIEIRGAVGSLPDYGNSSGEGQPRVVLRESYSIGNGSERCGLVW